MHNLSTALLKIKPSLLADRQGLLAEKMHWVLKFVGFASLSGLVLAALFLPGMASAQVNINKDVCKNVRASGSPPSFCKDQVKDTKDPNQNPIYGPNGIVTKVVNILSIVVGIAAVIFIIVAGFRFIVSGDNSQEIGQQREYIIYALVALVIVALAQAMVRFILLKIDTNY